MDEDLKVALSASKMRLRAKSPYFAVLSAYLKPIQVDENSSVKTAVTDGSRLYVHKNFWMGLKPLERDFVLVHEVLHAALGHCWRVGGRNPFKWNIAADYVVNLIAKKAGFQPPHDVLLDDKYAEMTTEEVYALLPDIKYMTIVLKMEDIIASKADDKSEAQKTWAVAVAQADAATKMFGQNPLGAELKVQLEKSTIDWRHILWKELTSNNSEFSEWDRRLIGDEMFVETLEEAETLPSIALCVDTSGSTQTVLGKFCGEVKQISDLYGDSSVDLYFADAAIIGPLPLDKIQNPIGGGGTSFVPFFEEVEKRKYTRAVYLTDLYGEFPSQAPKNCDVLWVVPPGSPESVPFGRVLKIIE